MASYYARRQTMSLLLPPAAGHGIALFSKFRDLDEPLAAEWAAYRRINADKLAHLANNAVQHHYVVSSFCRIRPVGCSWAEHHALVDASIEPFAHMFDQNRIPAGGQDGIPVGEV